MANRGRRRVAKRVRKSARAREAALEAALNLAFEMEEPLNQATWFVRVLEQIGGREDEIDAIAFVASEARTRLEAVHGLWSRLLDSAKTA